MAAKILDEHLPGYSASGLIACHACDCVHRIVTVPPRGEASCRRCGSLLYRNVPHSLDRSTALFLAAMLLLVIANSFPFVALEFGDRSERSLLVSGGFALQQAGMGGIGLLVLLTSVVFPFVTIGGMLYLLLPLRLGFRPPAMPQVWRVVRVLNPWSLIGVFMLGLLVSIVKLQDMAMIVPGAAFFAFIGLLVVAAAAMVSFDPGVFWPRSGPVLHPGAASTENAAEMGYATCPSCDLLVRHGDGLAHCPRCNSGLHGMRLPDSLARSWALLVSATLLLIPANFYPVMTVSRFGKGEPSTIISGVIHLIEDGAWPLGLLVLFASFVVPISKIVVLGYLLVSVQRGSARRLRDRTHLYHVTEVVGAWSMVDIFLVGILVALVRMDGLASVSPGLGASFFGASVVLTMMAAHSFDPRLIWDRAGKGPLRAGRRSRPPAGIEVAS